MAKYPGNGCKTTVVVLAKVRLQQDGDPGQAAFKGGQSKEQSRTEPLSDMRETV